MNKAGQRGGSNVRRWFPLLRVLYQVIWMQPDLCYAANLSSNEVSFPPSAPKGMRAPASGWAQRWWAFLAGRAVAWPDVWAVWVGAAVKALGTGGNAAYRSWLLVVCMIQQPICFLSYGADMASSVSRIIKKNAREVGKKARMCLSKHSLNIKFATQSLNIKYNTIAPHDVSDWWLIFKGSWVGRD